MKKGSWGAIFRTKLFTTALWDGVIPPAHHLKFMFWQRQRLPGEQLG